MKIGETAFQRMTIKESMLKDFGVIVGDTNPIHLDDIFAQKTVFGKRIAQGMLVGSLISGVLGTRLPGPGCIYLKQQLVFHKPTFVEDELEAWVKVIEVKKSSKGLIVHLNTWCINQHKEIIVDGFADMLVPFENDI